MKSYVDRGIAAFILVVMVAAASGCNTMRGAGEDVRAVGRAIVGVFR